MKLKALTIKDIARELGLSVSTVSKALHGNPEISTETRLAVVAYAEKHNYKPNPIAQNLKKCRSKSIGVIVCHIDNNFFSQAINGIESIAHTHDYNVIITQSHDSSERELLNIQHLVSSSVDGIIISLSAGSRNMDILKKLHDDGLPIVFFDRVTDALDTHTVIADNFTGAYEATMHLVKQGYKRIAHITNSASLSNTMERLDGYKKALQDAGLPMLESNIKYCDQGGMAVAEAEKALHELISQQPQEQRPDAIFIGADRLSIITISILKKMHIQVPQQVALAGYTNSMAAEIFDPPLTSVVQPAKEMGVQAMEMLILLMDSPKNDTPNKQVLRTELVVRESSQSVVGSK
jgi:LacI family transcriptional regulator